MEEHETHVTQQHLLIPTQFMSRKMTFRLLLLVPPPNEKRDALEIPRNWRSAYDTSEPAFSGSSRVERWVDGEKYGFARRAGTARRHCPPVMEEFR